MISRFLCALTLFLGGLWAAPALSLPMGEAEFKAAGVYNILLFVQWPESALPSDGSFRLCRIGAAPLTQEFAQLQGRSIHQRTIALKVIEGTLDEAQQCDAIWIESDRPHAMGRMAVLARQRPLLIIGEGADAVDRGAMISLSIEKGSARLRMDNTAARESGLVIGARLMRLAVPQRSP